MFMLKNFLIQSAGGKQSDFRDKSVMQLAWEKQDFENPERRHEKSLYLELFIKLGLDRK